MLQFIVDALEQIERRNWLYNTLYKHEVYSLIRQAFPSANKTSQKRFIRHSMVAEVLPGQDDVAMRSEDRKIRDYERYNVAVWLNQVSPKSEIAQEHLTKLREVHSEFRPREHPDFGLWTSGFEFVAPKSPISVEELAKSSVLGKIDFLLTYSPEEPRWDGPDREGLLNTVEQTVADSFEWAWELVNQLAARRKWQTDLWRVIFAGLKTSGELTEDQRNQILSFILKHTDIHADSGMDILRLLDQWLDNSDESGDLMRVDLVESLADHVFASEEDKKVEMLDSNLGWLTLAINRIGGRAAIVWLKTLSIRRAENQENWLVIPDDYRTRFEQAADGQETRDQFARTVLAAQFQFPFNLDREWTEKNLLFFFDWDHDELIAEQSWNGFLNWGRWSNEVIFSAMLPYTIQTFSRQENLGDSRDRFCEMLGSVAAYTARDPWDEGWLMDFMRQSDADSRQRWAISFGRYLHNLSPEVVEDLWKRWVQQYWKDRNTGVPVPLSDKEKEEMILWSIPLQTQFEAVVDRIVDMQAPVEYSHGTFHRLQEGEISQHNPQATLRLLNHMLSDLETIPYDGCKAVFNVAKDALEGGALRDDLLAIAEALARLGCREAQEIKRAIENR